MLINFVAMFIRRNKAEQLSRKGGQERVQEAKKLMTIITKYMLPANILFGVIAIYVGGMLRGF